MLILIIFMLTAVNITYKTDHIVADELNQQIRLAIQDTMYMRPTNGSLVEVVNDRNPLSSWLSYVLDFENG
jgi:hypothetical protein